jgi:DNA-binding MarR family transcriptional regulator
MATEAGPGSAASEAWLLIHDLVFREKPRFVVIAHELDLAPMQVRALLSLAHASRPMSALAGVLHCDASNVTGIVDRLEERGYAARRPHPDDRRVKLLALTPEGEALAARIRARMAEPPAALAHLPEEDARTLRDVLRRAVDDPTG